MHLSSFSHQSNSLFLNRLPKPINTYDMKNLKTTVAIFLFIVTSATAQNHKFVLGIEGGPNYSRVYGFEQLFPLEGRIGYSFAISTKFNFSNKFSIVSGVGIETKGDQTKNKLQFTGSSGNTIGYYKLRANFNYLNIPIMVRYTFGENKWHYYFSFGGYFGLLINAESEVVGYNYSDTVDGDISEYYYPTDSGISGGFGILYNLNDRMAVSVEVRDNLGLFNISKGLTASDGSNKNNSLNLLFGLSYGIGKDVSK